MDIMKSRLLTAGAVAGAIVASVVSGGTAVAAWEPTKQVTFIIPAGTGGGADQMARFIQGVVTKHNLMSKPLVVINKAGGAGAEGFLDVKTGGTDPHKIIITLSNLFTTPVASGVVKRCWRSMSSSCGSTPSRPTRPRRSISTR
jgi:putative tricarboxylic transport membrane protein